LLVIAGEISAQVTDELLRQQLVERGIDEGLFRKKLQERGVMYESIDQVPPEKYPEIEVIVKEILAELETSQAVEKQTMQLSNPQLDPTQVNAASTAIQDVRESVSDGSSVEEAVVEAIAEKEPDLPPAKIYGQAIFRNQTYDVSFLQDRRPIVREDVIDKRIKRFLPKH
jgi:hypothetical protein